MPVEIRNYMVGFTGRLDALRTVQTFGETVFGEPTHEEDLTSPAYGVVDDDRAFLAWDGDVVAGTCANFSLQTSTPGGSLPTAGVTWIGVLPTHRRRGVMSQMLTTLHEDGMARNEPIAALWAADAAIYGRFGYGVATQRLSIEIPHAPSALQGAPSDPSLRLRMVDTADDFALTAPIYEDAGRRRGGVLAIDDKWNAAHIYDPPHYRDGATRTQTVVAEDDDGVRGFLRYALKESWPTGRFAEGSVVVRRLMSLDAAAHAALWSYCFSLDLMTKTTWWNLPVDDPVLSWLEHSRQTTRQVNDAMWVRILDLPTALSGRAYATDIDVTLKVTDSKFAQNAGTWRLSGGPDGASCKRTSSDADLCMDIRTLSSILLGGPTLMSHGHAGWVGEQTHGALAATSAAFGADWAAYCPFVF
ncbi:MAG: GNAT family N-acetyltransferase [Actinomycetes bacterium]